MNMLVFDKSFDVELIDFTDKSTKRNISRSVIYKADGEIYHYTYMSDGLTGLGAVVKSTGEKVYSPWNYIPNGFYYEEIGRRLSVKNSTQKEEQK